MCSRRDVLSLSGWWLALLLVLAGHLWAAPAFFAVMASVCFVDVVRRQP